MSGGACEPGGSRVYSPHQCTGSDVVERRAAVEAGAPTGVTGSPGLGLGWTRVAQAVAEAVPREDVDAIWLFAPVRRDEREWGTAVISARAGEGRRRIYTGSYMLIIRGRERGQARVVIEEVGESPTAVVHEVIAGVQERAGEPDPPVEVAPELWYGDQGDQSPSQG